MISAALINKGRALSQLHKFDEAISNYDKALGISSNNTEALINKAYSLYNLDKKTDALSEVNKVLQIDPSNQLALGLRQNIEMDKKNIPK